MDPYSIIGHPSAGAIHYRIADEAPVDTVVVGEAVCSKRAPFKQDLLPGVVERLEAAGKQVVHASLILVSLARERRPTRELMAAEDAMVEVNDLTCLATLANRAHIIGPFVNVYNEATARFLAERGALRIPEQLFSDRCNAPFERTSNES